ncbi:RdgB/HAM1 family non-canonical purine NTP pyrophosphatase [Pneumocystis murina B123]|uniref:Inosine triphosphate pyrophosphatase n=1 Tax=Pneumocystis murina (strain B123) TaxID=1069680 RepID=M7P4E3_PNEMU|nr:RdgB/HAM1 family non-canonical purine NTP pyrophosphatase [Pneumocystis murina B123]EMR08710.1 RdgB/HAM1 family non-canonical purine NTP pyrophosphatase [Pneumocystis murina B123]
MSQILIYTVIITGNIRKFEEIKEFFGTTVKLTHISLDLPEIQGEIHEIILDKCKKAVDIVKKPVIIEDTSLFFTSFNGLPGPYIKWFLLSLGLDGLVRLLEAFPDKTAEAVCLFAYCKDPGDTVHVFEGRTLGSIVPARGPTVFGWDAIFQPLDCDQTYAEMGQTLKHKFSHRSKALTKLLAFLKHANNDV